MNKLEFDRKYWDFYDKEIPTLIKKFSLNANTETEAFRKLMGYIWDAEVCLPPFYAVIPHLIYIASNETFEIAKDLWCYVGAWVSIQSKYRLGVPEEDAAYLYPALFAFAGHAFGIMALSDYKDGAEGTSLAKCDNGHLIDVTVYDSGIVPYEQEEESRIVRAPDLDCFEYPFAKEKENPSRKLTSPRDINSRN